MSPIIYGGSTVKSTQLKRSWYNAKKVKKMGQAIMRGELDIKILDIPKDVKEAVQEYVDAYQFMLGYEDAGNRYVSERLRSSYVGEMVSDEKGVSYVATNRGKPTGTIVAIPTTDNRLLVGFSHVEPDEEFESPIVGLYYALKNAQFVVTGPTDPATPVGLTGHEKRQFKRFILRAFAYFYPDEYSYSRGKNPVVYPKYEEIHKRQLMILGEEKLKMNAPQPPAKDAKNKGRKVTF